MAAVASYADALHEWAVENGATHALTLTLGHYPTRAFDADAMFRPALRKLLKAIAHDARGVPKRWLHRMRPNQHPFVCVLYEPTTREGVPFPHVHGFIGLRLGEEPLMRGVLRTRWGTEKHPDKPAHVLTLEPSRARASRAVVKHPSMRPTFELAPLRNGGWASYSLKKTNAKERLWTSAELLA